MSRLKEQSVEIIQKLLSEFSDADLSGKFDESEPEITAIRSSLDQIPSLRGKIEQKVEDPKTKNTLRTAARDITFNQAILELLDNSIDEWIKRGKKKKLKVNILLNPISATGVFSSGFG